MKNQLVMKTLLATALVMTFVACGKTKGGGAVRGRNKVQQAGGQQGQPTNPNTGAEDNTGDNAGENTDTGETVIDPTTPENSDDNLNGSGGGESEADGEGTDTATASGDAATPTESKPAVSAETKPAVGQTAQAAQTQTQQTVQLSNDQLKRMLLESTRYSGAGKDSLRQMLQAKMEANDNETSKTLNLKTANSIVNAALIVDREFKEVAVKFAQKINGKSQMTELQGTLGSNLTASLSKTRGSVGAEGTIQCLDKSARSCNVAHARILLGETGSRAVVNIIFRSSGMNVYADAKFVSGQKQLNREQEAFKKLFTANKLKAQNTDRINDSRLRMDSFEVVQGASAARINILTVNNEIITIKAPLLDFDVVGSRAVAFADTSTKNMDLTDLETAQQLKTNFQAMIQEARLTKNSKDGGLQFSLMVGPKNGDTAEVILTTTRVQTAIKTGNTLNND